MLGLNHIQMPGASSAGGKGVLAFENYWMAYHGLKPDKKDKCNQPQNWHPNYRYKQKYVMGCRSNKILFLFIYLLVLYNKL